MSLPTCPKCGSQLEVKLTLASGPRTNKPAYKESIERAVGELLDNIDDNKLTGKCAEFVSETRERFEQYGSRIKMSDKQMAWLNRIADGESGGDW